MARSKKTPQPKTRDEPRWRTIERVVALLERTLAPGARVEHDVLLPNLRLQGHECQCDVVIRSGAPPRETLTIVEVQKRSRAVDVNTFRGWCGKMTDVGAQHLICVSTKSFPQSVIDDAKVRGPTVRLVLLKEMDDRDSSRLAPALGGYPVRRGLFQGVSELSLTWEDGFEGPAAIHPDAPLFELRPGQLVSLQEAIQIKLATPPLTTMPLGLRRIRVSSPEPLKCMLEGTERRVRVDCVVALTLSEQIVPATRMTYVQAEDGEEIAWVMTAEATFEDGRHVGISVTFREGDDGRLVVGRVAPMGMRDGSAWILPLEGGQALAGHALSGEQVVMTHGPGGSGILPNPGDVTSL